MKNKNMFWLAALLLAVGIAACTKEPPKAGPWGYDFVLGAFKDLRPADSDSRLVEEIPFRTDRFMASWQRHTARSVFASEPAKLDITLTNFEATRSLKSYALTMDVELYGRDRHGRKLAEAHVRCNVVGHTGAGVVWESVQQMVGKAEWLALTPEGRNATMWQQVWDTCVQNLTERFGQALLSSGV